MGATHVALVVSWSQRDTESTEIHPGDVAVSDRVLRAAIRAAHREGLSVLVFPILTVERTGPGQWRGTLEPADVATWWASYERFILHYARISAAEEAAALLVGSELGSTEAWRGRWYQLISKVEEVYQGSLVYSANWDHYEQVSFWRRLDAIGVTGYFELSRDPDAGLLELLRAWRRARAELVRIAAEREMPLWITEVGYPSRAGAAARPWDYTRDGAVDLEVQRRAYRAFAIAWGGVPELSAVFFWNWHGAGGPGDRDYTPRGKPAERVLRRFYSPAGCNDSRSAPAPSTCAATASDPPSMRK